MSRMLSKMNLISVVQQLPKEDIETIQGYVEMIEQENNIQKAMIENFVKENQELNQKYLNAVADYEQEKFNLEELKKQLEERDKWLIVCISELMEEYKKDTIFITNQQIESTKNKNISYEVYGGNDIKFYQNIEK